MSEYSQDKLTQDVVHAFEHTPDPRLRERLGRAIAGKGAFRRFKDELFAAGVQAPTLDEAWRGVRRGIVYGFFLWAITLKVDPAVTSILLERLGTAAADHDAFAAIG